MKRILWGIFGALTTLYVGATIYAYWPGPPEVPVAQLTTNADRFVGVGGLQLRYREYGTRGPGRANVVLIHGFANSLQSFRELAPLLAECCYVVAIDLPGYGLSGKPADFDYHNEPQARVIIAAARALDLERPVYAGHSLGGAVALWAAHRDPTSAGLVLMNPGILTTGVPAAARVTWPPIPRLAAKQFGKREFRAEFLRKSYVNPAIVTEKVVDDVMLASRSEGYLEGMTALMRHYSAGEEIPLLAQVRVPTLILWGMRDRNKLPAEADDLQRQIPGSQLVRFATAGHYVHEEAPEECALTLRVWLETSLQ